MSADTFTYSEYFTLAQEFIKKLWIFAISEQIYLYLNCFTTNRHEILGTETETRPGGQAAWANQELVNIVVNKRCLYNT